MLLIKVIFYNYLGPIIFYYFLVYLLMQLFVLLLLLLLFVLLLLIACINYCFNSVLFLSVVPGEELMDPSEESVEEPSGARTPPTPPAGGSSSQSRQRAMAQLRPVSMADTVKSMAGKDPVKSLQDFDRNYMPDGQPDAG
jgi:hypothetical protein